MKISTVLLSSLVLWVSACADPEDSVSSREGALGKRVGPPHECCFFEGEILTTVVPPSALPTGGRDAIYAFAGDTADGQLPVSAVAPGGPGYHGGAWAVHEVTFAAGVTPTLLTSADEVLAAEAAGEVTIVRVPENDFRCPVQRP
jgi:hypothetical protein